MMEMMKEMDFGDPANMADMMNGFQAAQDMTDIMSGFQTGRCKNGSACRPCGNGRGRPGDSLCSDEVFYDEGSIGYSGRKRTFGRDDADRDGEDRVSFGEACRREDEGRGADVFG